MKKYDSLSDFDEGLAAVKLNGKYGYVNDDGKEISSCKYDNVFNFKDGVAVVYLNLSVGLINKEGKEAIPLKYDDIIAYNNKYTRVLLNHKYYFIDLSNPDKEILFTNHIDNIGSRNDTLYYEKYKDIYIMSTGCFIGTLKEFKDAVIETHDKSSKSYKDYMDIITDLKEKIEMKKNYDYVGEFHEGLARVKLNNKYGFINKDGNEVNSF